MFKYLNTLRFSDFIEKLTNTTSKFFFFIFHKICFLLSNVIQPTFDWEKWIVFGQNKAHFDEWDHLESLCQMCLKLVEEIYFLVPFTDKQTWSVAVNILTFYPWQSLCEKCEYLSKFNVYLRNETPAKYY